MNAVSDPVNTMRPCRLATIGAAASRASTRQASRLAFITRRQSASVVWSSGAAWWMPALATRMSSRPCRATTPATPARTAASSVTSNAATSALRPRACNAGLPFSERRRVAPVQHDGRAGLRERFGDAPADAARRARDERDAPIEREHRHDGGSGHADRL
jgi:hypothetical protein